MRAQLLDLYTYNHYYNNEFLNDLRAPEVPEQCLQLMAHIFNTHHIWLRRIQNQQVSFQLWQAHDLETQGRLNQQLHQETFQILEETGDLAQQYVFYQNNEGRSYVNKHSEILFHLINHSTHHRAQIALLLRQAGIVPTGSDYIFYKRGDHLVQNS